MEDDELRTVNAMQIYGGSFVQALAECFYRADRHNFERLKLTFSDYWATYEKISKEIKENT